MMIKEREETGIQLFEKAEFGTIRTVVIDGDPWFVAKDVCNILEIKNPSDALNKVLEESERARFNLGRQGEANIISESGFYTLVLRSRKPIAKPFRLWVTQEVLPSIRKTGMYQSGNKMENILSEIAETKVVYAELKVTLDTQVQELKSVVDNMTISTRQQERILKAGRDRVNMLLGGAHSAEYKRMGRIYLSNLWNNFKADLHCGSSYKDLNPKDFNKAMEYISNWEYTEV